MILKEVQSKPGMLVPYIPPEGWGDESTDGGELNGLKSDESGRWSPVRYWHSLSPKTQFQVAAAVVVCCSMAILGQWMSARITSSYVHARADAGALYMEGFLAPHVQELADGRTALSQANTRSLDRLLIDTGLADRVEGIRIWLRDGRIAYSTDRSLTGKKMPSSDIEANFHGNSDLRSHVLSR